MLIHFAVDHFRSFGEEQTLNMIATGLKDHLGHCVQIPGTEKSVLQIGVIYGANASGKSNLVKAMLFTQLVILGRMPLARLALDHFRFARKEKPTSFEFRFLADGQVFVYGFTITRDAVVEEWLDATSQPGREIKIFTRNKEDIRIGRLQSFGKDGIILKKTLEALKLLGVREDQLLLNKILDLPTTHRGQLLGRVVWWFTECLTIVQAHSEFAFLIDKLCGEESFRKFCSEFLKNVGTGINGLKVDQTTIEADKVPKPFLDRLQALKDPEDSITITGPGMTLELDAKDSSKVIRKNLVAQHQVRDTEYSISFQEESDGTQRCLNLLPALYHLTREYKVFVVDELDRSLHPLLCYALLKHFLDACPGKCQQMIVTTHETHLLDLDLLRRDEIWFMEKDREQQSRLSSLVDWNTRKDLRIEKGYLQGRFGGIPFIGDTKKLMDMIQCPVNGTQHEKKTPTGS